MIIQIIPINNNNNLQNLMITGMEGTTPNIRIIPPSEIMLMVMKYMSPNATSSQNILLITAVSIQNDIKNTGEVLIIFRKFKKLLKFTKMFRTFDKI